MQSQVYNNGVGSGSLGYIGCRCQLLLSSSGNGACWVAEAFPGAQVFVAIALLQLRRGFQCSGERESLREATDASRVETTHKVDVGVGSLSLTLTRLCRSRPVDVGLSTWDGSSTEHGPRPEIAHSTLEPVTPSPEALRSRPATRDRGAGLAGRCEAANGPHTSPHTKAHVRMHDAHEQGPSLPAVRGQSPV